MDLFLQLTLAGLAIGFDLFLRRAGRGDDLQATDHFNFAQGEMAMFSTYVAWTWSGSARRSGCLPACGRHSFLAGVIIDG